MKRRLLTALLALAAALTIGTVAACNSAPGVGAAGTVDRDTLTRRQKDSIVSTMPLPGASRIRDAQTAVDRANARTTQHDTIR